MNLNNKIITRHQTRPNTSILKNKSSAQRKNDTSNATEPPHYLQDYIAVDEWKRVASQLAKNGLFTPARRALLAGYCSAVAQAIRAEETLLREGRYYETETSRGSVMRRRHPAAQDAEQAWAAVRKFAKQLGIAAPNLVPDNGCSERRAIFK